MSGPFTKGLSHTPERYAAKGIRAESPYPGLYVGGEDLTLGDSFSGAIVGAWLAANAVVGYGTLDLLFLEKNITADLERFLDPPILPDDPDGEVAVPYKAKEVPEIQEAGEVDNTLTETMPDGSS